MEQPPQQGWNQPPHYPSQPPWSQPGPPQVSWGQNPQWGQQAFSGWQQLLPRQHEEKRASKIPVVFVGAILLALLSFVIGIYYALPGVNHMLVSGTHPPLDPQPAHVLLFMGVAILCIIVALVTRPKPAR